MTADIDLADIARQVKAAQDAARQFQPLTTRYPGLELPTAYAISNLIHEMRIAEGGLPVGRKIGFTNPRMWGRYGVQEPIWAFIYDTTVTRLSAGHGQCGLNRFTEPQDQSPGAHGSSSYHAKVSVVLLCNRELETPHAFEWPWREPRARHTIHGVRITRSGRGAMRMLLLAIVLVPSLAYADGQNVYEFDFTGAISDSPCCSPPRDNAKFENFTVTFLSNSPTLPFPGPGDPFSASLNAYDVQVVIGNQVVLQDGTGAFAFGGRDQGSYTPGEGVFYFGYQLSFSSAALTFFGIAPDFSIGFPDPLNAGYSAGDGGCSVPGTNTEAMDCGFSGSSYLVGPVSAPEPGTLTLFALGLAGLALTRRRSLSA
jgi:hypothetical protein